VLLANTNVPSRDVTDSDYSQRPPQVVTVEIDARDLNETESFGRYITGEERLFLYYLFMSSPDLSQTLLSNVQ